MLRGSSDVHEGGSSVKVCSDLGHIMAIIQMLYHTAFSLDSIIYNIIYIITYICSVGSLELVDTSALCLIFFGQTNLI